MFARVSTFLMAFILSASGSVALNSNPDKRIRTKDGVAVVIAFPEKNIPLPTDPTLWNKLARLFDFDGDDHWKVGHAGLMLIDKNTGEVEYVDFGRYEDRIDLQEPRPLNFGTVRSSPTVPGLKLDVKAKIVEGIIENLDTLLIHLASKPFFEGYGRLEASVYDRLNLENMKAFVASLSEKGYIKYGCPTQQYCSRFARQVIRKGGGRYSLGIYTGQQMVKWGRKNL